jgi:hypothetical protein
LPLGLLDYPEAGTLWNVLGFIVLVGALGLILRELKIPLASWAIFPILALGLLCSPIRTQIAQGQWNAPLLLLLTLAWAAERRGHPGLAGLCVGTAVMLKLFPILFLAHFAVRRRRRAVITGCLSIALLSLATAGVLGVDAYRDYARRVMPSLDEFRSGWDNASISAFWMKNFSSGATHYGLFVEPVVRAPGLARAGIVVSCLSVLAATLYLVRESGPGQRDERACGDLGFALTMTAMLLLTPICWDHYLLLLALPLALIWIHLGRSPLERLGFLVLVAAVWAGPDELWRAGGVDLLRGWPDFQQAPPRTYVISRPLFVPLFLSVHFYAILATYAWLAARAGARSRRSPAVGGVHDP